ncbi:MAG: hypothetical protein P3A28_06855 [Gemmatimonadota bacterium]|nr:hypothetical protein [Gemmatimonadota bacterium]
MRRAVRALVAVFGALALPVLCAAFIAPAAVGAQAITPPNIKGPINAAKSAAEKTNEQTTAAERVSTPAPAKAASAPQTSAQKSAPAPAGGARPGDSAGVSQAGRQRGAVTVYREAFSYVDGGRRDPFVSLMLSGELRPILTDLQLTGVVYDEERPANSVALLVDISTGESYRRRINEVLGRMKVTKIGREDITFSIDEFGLSRSETLIIDKTKKAGPAPATRRP